LQSTCPNCGKHDDIYVRSGGALVCRACFVTETLLGSWLALPELRQVAHFRHTSRPHDESTSAPVEKKR